MSSWTRRSIGDISVSCLGKMLDKTKNKGEFQPYLSNKTVRWGDFDLHDLSQMRFESHEEERYGIKNKDLIVCEGGEPGRCAIWRDEVPGMKIQKALHRVRVKPGFDPLFLYYRMLLAGRTGELEKYFIGSTIKHLTGVNLKKIEFNFPEYDVQIRTSSVLDNLDAKIRINQRINAELEAMAKTIYDYWFVQFDFPMSKEQAKAIDKPKLEGKPYKSSGGKLEWNEELKREVPDGWKIGVIGDLGDIIGGSTPSTANPENFEINGTAWITPKDLSINKGRKYITKGEVSVSKKGIQNASLKIMPEGTILLSSRAPIGYMAIARKPLTSNQGFKNIVPSKKYSSEIVYYMVKNLLPVIEKNASGSTFKEISGSVLKSIKTLLPPQELANALQKKLSPIFRKQDILEQENQKLSELRDWLLPMLMNGQVTIKHTTLLNVAIPAKHEGKPANQYFYQTQLVAAIINASKANKISHGEMTLAKYTYLLDRIYGVPTYFNFERWHLGPYPKEIKKVVNNKKFFKIQNNEVAVVPQKKEYGYDFQQQVNDAIIELASMLNQYKGKERSHQTELLATVCKVVEDIKSIDLKAVRSSMKSWPIDLKTSKYKNKAEKFSEAETSATLKLIAKQKWTKALLG